MSAQPETLIGPGYGPRDEHGHEWGLKVGYFITPEDARAYAADPTHTFVAVGIRGQMGPGCFRCKMAWDECNGRDCPGVIPKEIERMRKDGTSHLWGLDRKTRRLQVAQDRRAAIKRGEDPDAKPAAKDPRERERDELREKRERDALALRRNVKMRLAFEREARQARRKLDRMVERDDPAAAKFEAKWDARLEGVLASEMAGALLGGPYREWNLAARLRDVTLDEGKPQNKRKGPR